MDAAMQIAVPVAGIVAAAAAVTFYAVGFAEIRERSLRELDECDESGGGGFESSLSSRKRRARREADKPGKVLSLSLVPLSVFGRCKNDVSSHERSGFFDQGLCSSTSSTSSSVISTLILSKDCLNFKNRARALALMDCLS
ncbi:hypothetical protein NL676_001299 [Syzygium grande]|nr:hypothetical protein NL676_001299 [Syzygium grande]